MVAPSTRFTRLCAGVVAGTCLMVAQSAIASSQSKLIVHGQQNTPLPTSKQLQENRNTYLGNLINLEPSTVGQRAALQGAEGQQKARLTAMRQAAIAMGAQGGLHFTANAIVATLKRHAGILSKMADFRRLLITDASGRSILPPVMGAVDGQATVSGDGQMMRAQTRSFKVEKPARFVLAAPTWRDYLGMQFAKPVQPDDFLLPENSEEQKLWAQWVTQGWVSGVQQAERIASNNLRTMVHDIRGMILFHLLESYGYVDKPVVDKNYYPVTGGGQSMAIEDVIVTIKRPASLDPNPDHWRPIPQLPTFGYLGIKDGYKSTSTLWETGVKNSPITARTASKGSSN